MSDLLQLLRNPDASSSLIPLLAVTGILLLAFFAAFILAAAKIWRIIKTISQSRPKTSEVAEPAPQTSVSSDSASKMKESPERIDAAKANEINALRQLVDRLQHEAIGLRETNAKLIRRIAELEAIVVTLTKERDDARKMAELEGQLRSKVEEKGQRLEGQLQEIIVEVEKIYQQNAYAADSSPASDSASNAQAAEIKKLKSVLAECRTRIASMATRTGSGKEEKD